MIDPNLIQEHMPVVDTDGQQFATVDGLDGTYIKLTKGDQGQHHWIPLSWVSNVDDQVHIDRPDQQAMQEWLSSPPEGMMRNAGGIGGTRS